MKRFFTKTGIWLLGGAAAGELPALVGLVLGTVLCFAVFCKLLEKPYLRRMTARKGTARTAYHARKTRPVSLRQALLRRELLHLGSSSAYMLNSAMGTLGLLVLGGVPFFLPKMHERYTFGADVLALAIAAYNPKRVWLPLLFGLSSYICYTAGLPGDAIFDLKWATVFQGAAVALTAAALYRSLNEEKAEAALAEVKA